MGSEIQVRAARGLAWVGAASTAVGLLDWLALVLILRTWVSPEEYGIAAIVVTLLPALELATDLGLMSAVIQRDDHSERKLSTIFWLNLAMSLLLFGGLCAFAPWFARAHGHPVLAGMLVAYGGKLVWQNLYAIPTALLKRELRFKELSIVRIAANLAEFGGKLGFAAAGLGIWCFVLGPLCRAVVFGIGVQICRPWRPRWTLALREAADYVRFGLKTSASQILFQFYTNVDYQVVSLFFGAAATGFYRLAYELVLEPVRIISSVIVEIAFPVFARLKTARDELVAQFLSFTRLNLVVVLPYLALVLIAAEDAIRVFFGPEWVAAATAARLLCLVGLLRALSFVVPPLLDGIGRPTTTLVYMVAASITLPTSYVGAAALLGERFGYLSVAMAWVAGYPIAFAILVALALRRIGMNGGSYLRATIGVPACTLGAAAGALLALRLIPPATAPFFRLLALAAVMLAILAPLLAWAEGIRVRTVLGVLFGSAKTR